MGGGLKIRIYGDKGRWGQKWAESCGRPFWMAPQMSQKGAWMS